MKLKLFESKKLHYGEYLYKLVLHNSLANIFRTEFQKDGKLGYARQKLDHCNFAYKEASKDNNVVTHFSIPWMTRNAGVFETIRTEQYFDALKIYNALQKQKNYKIRIERNWMYLYSNDKAFLTSLINSCNAHGEFWEPNLETIDLIKQDKNVILSKKPVTFKYKITLGSKKGSTGLADWIDANPSLAKMGDLAKQACSNKSYVKGYYFYVKNDKALFLVQMIVGDNIARIDRFVYPYE